MDFKKCVLEILKEKGLTMTELGGMIGKSPQSIRQTLQINNPKLSMINEIMSALGYEVTVKKKA